ncbi:centromere protein L [Strongylocentrotus purpuratus]|uniref:Centromere protein L n=1 Tax=Strongylocentrotus purpuratus TaxID=7668 RepID=A0A7M7N837_STRPU|nr:centromere protein L [Strongylocentrotus purpuratus]
MASAGPAAHRTRVQVISPERTPGLQRPASVPRSFTGRRLHTPYLKTPQSRILHGRRSRLTRTPSSAHPTNQRFSKLTNKTWHTYYVSPLYAFSNEAASLKRCSRQLSSHLQAESQKGVGVMVEDQVTSKYAVFSLRPELFPDSDVPAVELSIYASKSQAISASSPPAWTSIFCPPSSPVMGDDKHFSRLPLMLIKGAIGTTNCVLQWLQVQFDCCVRKLTFNPMALSWMVSMWAESLPDKKKNSDGDKKCGVELVYHLPKEISGLNKVTMTIDSRDARALWESVHEEDSDEVEEDEVVSFMKALGQHFHACFHIHLDALYLKTIGTAAAFVGAEGRLKMLSLGEASGVLQHLVELAEEKMASLDV